MYDGIVQSDKVPSCTETGVGHTVCTKCEVVVRTGITVPELKHDYRSKSKNLFRI